MLARSVIVLGLPLAWLPCLACNDEVLDTARKTPERGTLGEELYAILHRDLERDDGRRAEGFALEREHFVGTVDHVFPPDELRYTQEFLVKLLPLYDDGTLPNATGLLAGMLERLAADRDALRSLAAIGHRGGYRDHAHEEALIRRLADHPDYSKLVKAFLRFHLAHDGLDQFGDPDPNEPNELDRLARMFGRKMAELELSEDAERSIVLATELMLEEDERFIDPAAMPAEIVARDPRGMAKLAAITAPFSDVSPEDGLPDIDAQGRFVAADGAPIDIPPFDENGRALAPNGQPLYDTVAVERTMLAGLLRDARKLIHEGLPMRLVRTADRAFGPRDPASGAFHADNNPAVQLVHALGSTADMPQLPEIIGLVRALLEQHEPATAWLALEVDGQLAISDRYNVALRPGSTFFEDLMSVLRKILREPGLAEDIVQALRDPAVANLPRTQVQMLSHKKELITEADVENGTIFVEAVDRTQPDTRANQSLQQRLLHLIYDTKGAKYTPELIGIPLGFIFEIEDLAEFYMLSIIGEAHVPSLVSTLTGLAETPTPAELAAFINQDQTFGNPQGHEGIDVKDNDGDTLFAASASGTCDSLAPVIRVFYNRGQMRLLFELFEVLHLHWGTATSDIHAYEPMLIDIFQNARVLDATRRLLDETQDLRTSRGRLAHDALLILVRKLFHKDPELRALDGRREVTVAGERITPLSPFDLIRASKANLRAKVRQAGGAADYDAIIDALYTTLLEPERTGPESGRIKNPRAIPLASLVLSFLEERALLHDREHELSTWVTTDFVEAVSEMIASEELPAILDLFQAIEADTELDAVLTTFRDELLDETRGFPDLLVTLGDTMSALQDASVAVHFVRFLGREMDPSGKLSFTMLKMTEKTLAVDPDEHMLEVIRRSIDDRPDGQLYMSGLSAAIRQANRVNPLELGPSSADDLQKITGIVSRYLTDDQHGLEKFYETVRKRRILDGSAR